MMRLRFIILVGLLVLVLIASIVVHRTFPGPAAGVMHGHTRAAHPALVRIECFGDGRPFGHVMGFLVEPGYVVTNHHCIEGVSRARVHLHDGRIIWIRGLVAISEADDIAILELNASPETIAALPALSWAATVPEPGDPVWIVRRDLDNGHPSRTAGRIKRIDDDWWFDSDITAAIYSTFGFSGSPLINEDGEVLGVVRSSRNVDTGVYETSAAPAATARNLPHTPLRTLEDWWSDHHRSGWHAARNEVQWAHVHRAFEPDRALRHLTRAIGHDPEHVDAWRLLTMLRVFEEDYAAAEEAAARWTMLQPDQPRAWQMLGYSLFKVDRIADSMDAYARAMELRPDPDTLCWMSHNLFWLGRRDQALASLEQAIELDPQHAAAWLELGTAYRRLGRLSDLLGCPYLSPVTESRASTEGAEGSDAQRKIPPINELRARLDENPHNHAIQCMMGTLLLSRGEVRQARQAYETAAQLNPACRKTLWGLAIAAYADGDRTAAHEWIQRFLAVSPEQTATR